MPETRLRAIQQARASGESASVALSVPGVSYTSILYILLSSNLSVCPAFCPSPHRTSTRPPPPSTSAPCPYRKRRPAPRFRHSVGTIYQVKGTDELFLWILSP